MTRPHTEYEPTPSTDPFYSPPRVTPNIAPGTILGSGPTLGSGRTCDIAFISGVPHQRVSKSGGYYHPPKVEHGGSMTSTRYARSGDLSIAYQISGEGEIPLVYTPGLISHVEILWEEPRLADLLRRLGSFAKVILWDRRGIGLSDRPVDAPVATLEEQAEDLLAVLNAEEIETAAMFGYSEGGSLAAYFAAAHPDRVSKIVLWGTPYRYLSDGDEFPCAWSQEEFDQLIKTVHSSWGTRKTAIFVSRQQAPSCGHDDRFIDWFAKYMRYSVSPSAAGPNIWRCFDYDFADIFSSIRTPTLLLHRAEDTEVSIEHSRLLSGLIRDARLVELDGIDHAPYVGDVISVVTEVEDFLTGQRSDDTAQRRLVTIVVTDIVDSTRLVDELGDGPWQQLLSRFEDAARTCIAQFRGVEVKQSGDGLLIHFDGPARALRCAMALADAAERGGVDVRTGVHTGECAVSDTDITGVAVHIASRLCDLAAAGQIISSGTVRDVIAGSGIRFGDPVQVELPGVAGRRTVHEVLRSGVSPTEVRRLEATRAANFTRDGDYWTVSYSGRVTSIRHTAGMTDLAALLARPGREISALDLASSEGGAMLAPASISTLLDDDAIEAYRQRISALDEDIERASALGRDAEASALEEERQFIIDDLSAAHGLGARPRAFDDEAERARKTVSKRIRLAMRRIEDAHRVLGQHLDAAVRTGRYCEYQPDPIVRWVVQDQP